MIANMVVLFQITENTSGLFAIFAFGMLTSGLGSWKDSIELAEYRDKGTIDGITAWRIFEDQEMAKARNWWHFWR
jgi:hypothetical protein